MTALGRVLWIVLIVEDMKKSALTPNSHVGSHSDLNRPDGGRHDLRYLLDAILNPVESAMTSTDLLEAIMNPGEAAMTSMNILEVILMSMNLL
jgi:hypothetical protein